MIRLCNRIVPTALSAIETGCYVLLAGKSIFIFNLSGFYSPQITLMRYRHGPYILL